MSIRSTSACRYCLASTPSLDRNAARIVARNPPMFPSLNASVGLVYVAALGRQIGALLLQFRETFADECLGERVVLVPLLPLEDLALDASELRLDLATTLLRALMKNPVAFDEVTNNASTPILGEELLCEVLQDGSLKPSRRNPVSGTRLASATGEAPAVVIAVRAFAAS
jgi:hypothetical protein